MELGLRREKDSGVFWAANEHEIGEYILWGEGKLASHLWVLFIKTSGRLERYGKTKERFLKVIKVLSSELAS